MRYKVQVTDPTKPWLIQSKTVEAPTAEGARRHVEMFYPTLVITDVYPDPYRRVAS